MIIAGRISNVSSCSKLFRVLCGWWFVDLFVVLDIV
jgi:hypothetical protein